MDNAVQFGAADPRFDRWAAAAGAIRTNPLSASAGRVAASGATVIVYGPESSATDVSGDYALAAGSPYAVRVSGARHALPVGTVVASADGALPPGTYLKRVFPDDSIELSAPATKNVASGTLTFAAFTPEVRQTFSSIRNTGSDSMSLILNKSRAEDTLVVSTPVFDWSDTAGNLSVWTYSAYKPGVLSVCGFKDHDVESVANANLYLYTCELEITPPQNAAAYDEYVKLHQASGTTDVSVNPTTTGLSGGFDLVSHVCWYPFELQMIMLMEASRLEAGGGQIGELLVTKIGFSPEHLDELEAYFQKKWFNKIPEGYRAASLNSVSVASGATLEVTGGGPLTVNALAVAGGTVKFAGATGRLRAGPHVLVRNIGSATAANWTLDVSLLRKKYRRGADLYVEGDDLCLRLSPAGVVLMIR